MSALRWNTVEKATSIVACVVVCFLNASALAESLAIYKDEKPQAHLVCPHLQGPTKEIVSNTINGFLKRAYGWELAVVPDAAAPGTYIVAGTPENNAALRDLVSKGLKLGDAPLTEEGFRILTHETGEQRFIIVYATTPLGLKHGCQELVYFKIAATSDTAYAPWPMDETMNPAVAYRGSYVLPCWSAYDSLDSWRKVIEFNSELTLNRTWFWLNGFPLLPQYAGIYQGSDLSSLNNVRSIVELCHSEGMKFCIGGGWFTWHHKESASGSQADRVASVGAGGGEVPIAVDNEMMVKGIQYYLDLLAALPGADGIYLEPTGEGAEADGEVWRKHVDALGRLLGEIYSKRPECEVAIAIGRYNTRRLP